MGLRGPGAVGIRRRRSSIQLVAGIDAEPTPAPHSWEAANLEMWEKVVLFCESLPVTSGKLAGTMWKARPWQRKWIRRVYRTDKKGRRIVRTALLSLARKNGKTDLAARLCLCHLAGPTATARGEIYSAANDRLQAAKIFAEQVAIIMAVDWMRERISIRRHSKELEDLAEQGGTGSTYSALSSDVKTKMGLNVSFAVVDEYGQMTDNALFEALDSATGARDEPLILAISTQAARDDMPMSKAVDYGLRILRKEIRDPSFDLTLYTVPPEADIWDPKVWRLANPAIGDFRDRGDIERQARQAQRMPSREASFRNLILNQRVATDAQFITSPVWSGCAGAVDKESLKGRSCFAGLDLGGSRDLTALALVFPDSPDGRTDAIVEAWIAGDLREREDTDRAPYVTWAAAGWLKKGGDRTLDPKVVAVRIAELHGLYSIRGLAFDRWRIEDLRRELDAIGCDVALVEHGQGFKDFGPTLNEFERVIFEGLLRHGDNPLLTWAIANCRTESDPTGARKLSKQKSSGRIDPAVALAMAIGAIAKTPPPPAPSVYESRGLLVL
jgi:phage terminase large subunit-like protein